MSRSMRTVSVTIPNASKVNAVVSLDGASPSGPFSYGPVTTGVNNDCTVQVPSDAAAMNLHIHAPGYQVWGFPADGHVVPVGSGVNVYCIGQWPIPTPADWLTLIGLVSLFTPLPRLVRNDKFYQLSTGARFSGRDCTDFMLLGNMMAGQNIQPVLRQRRDIFGDGSMRGFNFRRVFFAVDVPGIGTCHPVMYPDIYTRLPELADRMAEEGAYLNLVVGAWPYTWATGNPNDIVREMWDRVGLALRDKTNVALLSLVNENNDSQNSQQIDPMQFDPIPGLLCSPGSVDFGQWPPAACFSKPWDAIEYHAGGDGWQHNCGHEPMLMAATYGIIGYCSEQPRSPDNESNANHIQDAAACEALLCAAGCFHPLEGKTSTLFGLTTLALAQAAVTGGLSISPNCQPGAYKDLNFGGDTSVCEREFQRGDDSACIVCVRP